MAISNRPDEWPLNEMIRQGRLTISEYPSRADLLALAVEQREVLAAWEAWERDQEGDYSELVNRSKAVKVRASALLDKEPRP